MAFTDFMGAEIASRVESVERVGVRAARRAKWL